MQKLVATPVSNGFALGKAFIFQLESLESEVKAILESEVASEKKKLDFGLLGTRKEIEGLLVAAAENGNDEQYKIFECYLEMITDAELINEIHSYISDNLVSLDNALFAICDSYVQQMLAIDDPYFQARADDFKQVFRMIKAALNGSSEKAKPTENFILVAKEIGPADMAKIDKQFLRGFILETGSRTSHAAIISRAMGIPMISGIPNIEKTIENGSFLALSGKDGCIYVNPSEEILNDFQKEIENQIMQKKDIMKLLHEPTQTLDGQKITLYANIGTVEELTSVLENNADGIGLFRTEFLFMENGGNRLPTEEEQFRAYKSILTAMNGKPVIFRTLDAGGDKNIAALSIPKEENPFLGWRAIRYCLKQQEVFRCQLRSLLRASNHGNAKIMIPMIISVDEILQTKKIIDEIYKELEASGEPVKVKVPVGIMIETPAAAVNAEELAKHVDFFSLGTNDLTQYTLAVDRGNDKIVDLYDEGHPAVLKLIEQVIAVGKKAGIAVDLCGEMGGDTRFTETLLRYGLKEFSMSPIHILPVKKVVRSIKL
ncbi:MAG: phosphoenolpyruvate--protein phosphotransferase [Treponemataceae bacterium]